MELDPLLQHAARFQSLFRQLIEFARIHVGGAGKPYAGDLHSDQIVGAPGVRLQQIAAVFELYRYVWKIESALGQWCEFGARRLDDSWSEFRHVDLAISHPVERQ